MKDSDPDDPRLNNKGIVIVSLSAILIPLQFLEANSHQTIGRHSTKGRIHPDSCVRQHTNVQIKLDSCIRQHANVQIRVDSYVRQHANVQIKLDSYIRQLTKPSIGIKTPFRHLI